MQPGGDARHQQRPVQGAELHKGHQPRARGQHQCAQVGHEVQHEGRHPPDRGALQAYRHEGQTDADADQHAGEQLHQQVTVDLRRDLVEHLNRDALLGEGGPGDLHHLAAKAAARDHQEIGNEDHHHRLPDRGGHAQGAGPEVVLDVEARALDADPRHAARCGRRCGALLRRLLQLRRGTLHLVDGRLCAAALRTHRFAHLLRRGRQRLDQGGGVVAQGRGRPAQTTDQRRQQQRSAQRPREPPAFHAVDQRAQRIAQGHAQQQRDDDRAAGAQCEQRGDDGQHRQRQAAHVDRHVQQHALSLCIVGGLGVHDQG